MLNKHSTIVLVLLGLLVLTGGMLLLWDLPSGGSREIILYEFRLPRLLNALACGIALPLSGIILQVFFRNPLAGPYVLGLGNGAGMGVALFILLQSGFQWPFFSWTMPMAAIAGSMTVLLLLILISRYIYQNTTLLIAGLFLGSVIGGFTALLEVFALPENLKSYLLWNMGSFDNTELSESIGITGIVILTGLFSLLLVNFLNAYAAGEIFAYFAGIPIQKIKYLCIIIPSLLTGLTMAYFGPIAFVGMAVPHIARLLHQTTHHLIIIPSSALIGAFLLLFTDLLSHHLLPGYVIPLNIFLSMMAGPFILWLILNKKAFL